MLLAYTGGEGNDGSIDVRIKAVFELDAQRRVSRGGNPHGTRDAHAPRASSAPSSFWWMSSKPPFDMTTTRSP